MKLLYTAIFTLLFTTSSFAQIQRIKSGNYKFAKGEIELTLVDTVSKKYVEEEIAKTGYEIISSSITPITFFFSMKKDELDLSVFESNPLVQNVHVIPNSYDSTAVEEMIIRQKMNAEEAERSRERFKSFSKRQFVRIYMNYWVTEETAMKFMDENDGINLQSPKITPKTVIVKTIPGKENEAMRELKKLDIVEYAAYIALID